jgi:antitoxin ParD1/3/4
MPAQLNVTLPDHMIDLVKRKVSSGEYATESDVVRESLDLLEDHEKSLEQWLSEVVGPAYDATHANRESGLSLDELKKELAARRKQTKDGSEAVA